MTLIIIFLIVALILSAFFGTAEMAIFSLSDSRVQSLVDLKRRGSASLSQLRARSELLLVMLRLGKLLSAVVFAVLGAILGAQLWGIPGLVVGAVLASLLLLLIAELMPLQVALAHAVGIALAVAPVLLVLSWALAPALVALAFLGRVVPTRPAAAGSITESEIRELTVLGQAEGVIEEHERQLIERTFRLDKTQAWDIMTPRVDIFAWRDSLKLSEIARQLVGVPYSRMPVYGESIDDITGVLYLRDAYRALVSGQRDLPLRMLAREPFIVPGSVQVTHLLRDFQTRRIHMAIVVDEYGGTDGLVTLEDVLEELVGEIVDEMDIAEEPILRVSRNEIIADGDTDLREINHHFNTSFPLLEQRSLNGYLLEELGRVPAVGESLEREGILIEVLEATETQVLRARLRRLRPMADVGESSAAADDGGAADDEDDDAGDSPGVGGGAAGLGEDNGPAPVKSERGAEHSRIPPGLRTSISAITTNRG
jgi:CBS domain containing-hemolysin-like protein